MSGAHKGTQPLPRLCFVLPEYSEKTHFRYVAEFARTLAEDTDVFLVVEKGDDVPRGSFQCYYRQRLAFPVLRVLEHFIVLCVARIRGYKMFYIHYSFVSAISAGIITSLTGGTVYYWNAGMPWKYARSTARELIEHLAYKLIDYVVTGAHALVPGYASYYGISYKHILVIPNWVEPAGPRPESVKAMVTEAIARPPEAQVLLFVHRLAKRKGAHHLPEILHRLKDENVVLVVIGDGPERGDMEHAFTRLGVAHKVRMLGGQPNASVEEALAQADVFLMPSEEEGSPHALLEAVRAGVPFVAFNVGGVYEHTPASCVEYLVDEGDVEAFVKNVEKLLHDKAEQRRFSDEERVFADRFSKARILTMFKEKILTGRA